MIYKFGPFNLDTDEYQLRNEDEVVPVEPQVFGVLAYLIENRDRVVNKDQLVEAIWDGRAVSDTTITSRINAARKAIGDSGDKQRWIKTFPRRGFRFHGEVSDSAPTVNAALVETPPDKASIAVLPFSNLGGHSTDDYIADGLTEDIITALSAVRAFFIVPRNSTIQFKGQSSERDELAHKLGVRYLVEGSVRKSGKRLRISVKLLDTALNNQVWAERYDKNFTDIFSVQDEISQTIIGRLEPELSRAEYERSRKLPSENLTAWGLYHRAMILFYQRDQEINLEARDLYRRAIDQDPEFARAYAGLSQTYIQTAVQNFSEAAVTDMLHFAKQAVRLDDRDYLPYIALGTAHQFTGDTNASLRSFESALELNPNSAVAHGWYGEALLAAGQADEAIAQVNRAIELSPGDPSIGPFYGRLSRAYYFLGQYQESVDWAEKAFTKNHVWPVRAAYCAALAQFGQSEKARAALDFLREREPTISLAFVRKHLPMPHQPYMEHFIEGLRLAGLEED